MAEGGRSRQRAAHFTDKLHNLFPFDQSLLGGNGGGGSSFGLGQLHQDLLASLLGVALVADEFEVHAALAQNFLAKGFVDTVLVGLNRLVMRGVVLAFGH